MRLLITALATVAGLFIVTSAVLAGSSVRITALDCGSHPRRIRIENQGDASQNLSGWQLKSDPAEGGPWSMSDAGALDAGERIFVFQGHLSPPTDPVAGYYRWGTDEIFNLRANDSSDYVRIVNAQGATVHQLNCEGLPPGATPAPPGEFDPPPVVQPTAAAPTAAPVGVTAGPSTTALAATEQPIGSQPIGGLPVGGGPPPTDGGTNAALWLAAGALMLAAGTTLTTLSFRLARRRR